MLLIGGEEAGVALAGRLRHALPGRILNMYGPTEATIWSTAYRIETAGTRLPIGSPLANTPVYVLDPNLDLLPSGIAGEIYIGGESVALGYLGRPGLTAERFVPDPFAPNRGSRMYRTGDRGRYRLDGSVEFLGRFDRQIKIRGHRVEPAEVEEVLKQHPSVQDCFVAALEVDEGNMQLVAYMAPTDRNLHAEAPDVLDLEWSSHVGERIADWERTDGSEMESAEDRASAELRAKATGAWLSRHGPQSLQCGGPPLPHSDPHRPAGHCLRPA
jgi:acyl-CoA synthetase (AMP-forming)/AMP-acid ligase II